MLMFVLIGWVDNEKENILADPTATDFSFMRQILVPALKSDNHYASEYGVRAEEMLVGIANLVACADNNVSDVIEARIPIFLGAVLAGPLQGGPSTKVKPGEYTNNEKFFAARCCHTMCFKPEGRAAIFGMPRLAEGPFYSDFSYIFNTIQKKLWSKFLCTNECDDYTYFKQIVTS